MELLVLHTVLMKPVVPPATTLHTEAISYEFVQPHDGHEGWRSSDDAERGTARLLLESLLRSLPEFTTVGHLRLADASRV
ncbi:hypothetical protein GN956_G12449 [Arapaima gigas]